VDLPQAYVELGLAFDRLERGFVDAWTGDPAVRTRVESGPPPVPTELADRAAALLAELPSAGLPADRADHLDGQLTGLRTSARVLAGEPVGFVEQVQGYFQVTPAMGEEAAYADAHRALEDLLPGAGPLAQRYGAYRAATAVPPERLAEAVREVSTLLRERVRAEFALPDAERVDYEVVTDRPWGGFNYYLGGYRSTVAINADLPMGLGALPALVAHESYPGHHTERCRKQQRLAARPEHQVWLVNTPENVVAEGLADLGLAAAGLGTGWGAVVQELYADLGIGYDGARGEAVAVAAAPLGAVRQDAALLLHDRGRSLDDAAAHLRRWGLQSPRRARKALEFLTSPLWRAYISTYVEGERLLSAWLAARPDGQPVVERFARLLDEPVTPRALRAETG